MSIQTADTHLPQPKCAAEVLEHSQQQVVTTDYSALSAQNFLLLHVSARGLTQDQQLAVADWLRRLPCPVLGITLDDQASIIGQACDVLLNETADAALPIANIRRTPIAATVLVQLLRAVEHLPLEAALVAESMAYATLQSGPEFRRWLDQTRREPLKAPLEPGPALVIERDGEGLLLELNRPENRNGMSVEMRDALVEALQLVLADSSIARIRLRGRGRCFSTGGDLREFGTTPDPATAHVVRGLSLPGRLLAQCAARVEAQLHGACIGSGIEFPAFAGHISAAADSYFQLPELRFGLMPGAGGCISIARRIGRQRTTWLALSGKRIDAQTALAWGLVDVLN